MAKSMLKLKQNHESNIDNIHLSFYPVDVRPNEAISAFLIYENGKEIKCIIWKISPVGVEIVLPGELKVEQPDQIKLQLKLGRQKTLLDAQYICKYQEVNKSIYCYRFFDKKKLEPYSEERREKHRWNCSLNFYPTGIANSPVNFNDFIYFKVLDISASGMQLTCSLRNKFLFPGIYLQTIINFPMISQLNLKLKIISVNILNDEKVRIGVTYDCINGHEMNVIGNYLAQFGDVNSIKNLKENGFEPTTISKNIDYVFVKTKEQYNDCLKLRQSAYLEAKVIDSLTSAENMADEYDSRSRIVNGYLNSNLTCSGRVTFNEPNDITEIEKYCNNTKLLPNKLDSVEITRLCTNPNYRGGDLLLGLMLQLALLCVQSKRRYAVLACEDKLLPLFKKIGLKETGAVYINPKFPSKVCKILKADLHKGLALGYGVNPIIWNLTWSSLAKYLKESEIVTYTPVELMRLKYLGLFKPIAYVFKKIIKRK